MPERLAFYNPVGPEPPPYPRPLEEIAPGRFFADLFFSRQLGRARARGIYTSPPRGAARGPTHGHAECERM
jgi:hypothetical protein